MRTSYSAYAGHVSVLVKSTTEIDKAGNEINRYEMVAGTKINRDKIGHAVGRMEGIFSSPSVGRTSWVRFIQNFEKRSKQQLVCGLREIFP